MPPSRPVTAEEKRWQAEEDAHTLARANVIREDPDRLKAAQGAAKKMAEDEREQANAMSKVAKGQQSRAKRPAGHLPLAVPHRNKATKADGHGIASMPVKFLGKK